MDKGHICPYCKKEFPMYYKDGRYSTRVMVKKYLPALRTGIALANFNRHKIACKEQEKFIENNFKGYGEG